MPESSEQGTADKPDRLGPGVLHDMRNLSEDTAQKLLRALESSRPVRTIRGSQVATAVAGTVGLALLFVGIENAAQDLPIIDSGWVQLGVGIILLAAAGVLMRRLME